MERTLSLVVFPIHALKSWRRARGWAAALLLLASCDRVIGLREGYYSSAAAAGVAGAGLGGEPAGGDNASGAGGTLATNGAGGGALGGAGGSGGANGGTMAVAGDGGGGAAPIGEAGASGGGAANTPLCADHPLTAESAWVPSASDADAKYPASAVTDGASTRWTTGKPQSGGEWLQIDFGEPVSIRRINLQQGMTYSNDYPRGYAVFVSDTNADLTGPVLASGVGASDVTTTIVLPQVFSGRYLLIEQLDTSLSWWSIEEIEVSCYDN